ncbi:protein rep [Geothrix oryzisoli]|uniref:protein rep n=1 Tax=Geothrix oryzisoli TaxID=2922721 RepID=UPI003B84887B
MGRRWGYFEAAAGAEKSSGPHHRLPLEEVARWIRDQVSPYPDLFKEVVEACKALEKRFLLADVKRLESCGTVWWSQHIVRVFWKDRHGHERLRRQIGIHRCKHAWCPTCGRSRQAQLTAEIERMLILSRDFGLHEGHGRLVTLTVPNGRCIYTLREQAHKAFAKLQRTRWWNRFAFGWVRGSEVVTGQDGDWNLHVHLLVIFWAPKVSYQQLGRVWTQELGGTRENGRRFVVDCESLESKRWGRKDGRPGDLKRRGGLVRAARYIFKYLTKAEDLKNLRGGPGGLAHLVGATKGLRKFSVGGGCSVLRRAANTLLPSRMFQAEEALAGTYLNQGRPPWRVEVVNPETGEIRDGPPERLKDPRQGALERWGEILETNPIPTQGQALPGRVVGVPCGPRGRYRRAGVMPLAGLGPTVVEFERRGNASICGVRALLGEWKVKRWQEQSQKSARTLKFAAVLPSKRYSWGRAQAAIKAALAHGADGWTNMRLAANREASSILLDPLARLDAHRALMANLPNTEDQAKVEVKNACDLAKERIQDLAYEQFADGHANAHLENLLHLVRHPNTCWKALALDQHPLPPLAITGVDVSR